MDLPFGIDFGGTGIKGAPVDLEVGDSVSATFQNGAQEDLRVEGVYDESALAVVLGLLAVEAPGDIAAVHLGELYAANTLGARNRACST